MWSIIFESLVWTNYNRSQNETLEKVRMKDLLPGSQNSQEPLVSPLHSPSVPCNSQPHWNQRHQMPEFQLEFVGVYPFLVKVHPQLGLKIVASYIQHELVALLEDLAVVREPKTKDTCVLNSIVNAATPMKWLVY